MIQFIGKGIREKTVQLENGPRYLVCCRRRQQGACHETGLKLQSLQNSHSVDIKISAVFINKEPYLAVLFMNSNVLHLEEQ